MPVRAGNDSNIPIGFGWRATEQDEDILVFPRLEPPLIKSDIQELNMKLDRLTQALTGKTAGGIYIARTMEEAIKPEVSK